MERKILTYYKTLKMNTFNSNYRKKGISHIFVTAASILKVIAAYVKIENPTLIFHVQIKLIKSKETILYLHISCCLQKS